MYVSEKHRFVYFAPTRSASNAISYICCNLFEAVPISPPQSNPAWPPGSHHSIFLPKQYEDYFTFTSVRNPYIREISKYNWLIQQSDWEDTYKRFQRMSFKSYLEWVCNGELTGYWRHDIWKRTLYDIIFNQPVYSGCLPVRVDRVIKVENLVHDFMRLPFVSSTNHLQIYLESKMNFCENPLITDFPIDFIDMFYDRFQVDFDFFEYEKAVPSYSVYVHKGLHYTNFYGRTITTNVPRRTIL